MLLLLVCPQAFPSVTHLIIRAGADDTTICMIGHNMTTLVHLELYNLAVGYSRSGLTGIAHLASLRTLILEIAPPFKALAGGTGHSSSWGPGLVVGAAGLVGEVAGDISAVAGNLGVPLLGTNPITAFSPPTVGMVSAGSHGFQPLLHKAYCCGQHVMRHHSDSQDMR